MAHLFLYIPEEEKDTPKFWDYVYATMENNEALKKFVTTNLFKDWVGQRNEEEERELKFQTLAKYYCGREYTGP